MDRNHTETKAPIEDETATEKELKDLRNQVHELMMRVMETRQQLMWTQTQLIAKLTGTDAGVPPAEPINYDSPDFDDVLNKQIEQATVKMGITSQVYHGRVVAIQMTGSEAIEIRQQSHHLARANSKYEPIRQTLSKETFILMLEAMEFAEKKFGLDRKAIIKKLTGGDEINFKDAIILL